ncbi:MAG TPA: aspartyl/asparaginyl beta-hydroxylase domain-containing protein [Xanthomonadaceae bacterium]|nr:aspartyl/asparaginyl beta-hydroxylase domain-containing protein [Xanthomonadaceae bacterium]
MKLQVPFIQLPVRFDADVLAAEVAALGEEAWRPHPQGYPGNSALTLVTTGGDPDSDAVGGRMLPTPWLRRCPYLMQAMASLGAVWGRSRLMRLSGYAEVTPHADINYYWRERMRVHLPIVTQPTVRFACGDAQVNMAAGECWIFDTWRMHHVVNDAEQARIHLVADTVGGDGFWELVGRGRAPGMPARPDWRAEPVPPRRDGQPELTCEAVNVPVVMTPWELREHLSFLLGEAEPAPALAPLQQVIARFSRSWQALWARYGEDPAGWADYRRALDAFAREAAPLAGAVQLRNRNGFLKVLNAVVVRTALAGNPDAADAETRGDTAPPRRMPAAP